MRCLAVLDPELRGVRPTTTAVLGLSSHTDQTTRVCARHPEGSILAPESRAPASSPPRRPPCAPPRAYGAPRSPLQSFCRPYVKKCRMRTSSPCPLHTEPEGPVASNMPRCADPVAANSRVAKDVELRSDPAKSLPVVVRWGRPSGQLQMRGYKCEAVDTIPRPPPPPLPLPPHSPPSLRYRRVHSPWRGLLHHSSDPTSARPALRSSESY